MRNVVRVIDSISEWAGKSVRWLGVILVVQVTYEVTMRYVFNSPSLWGYELGIMLGATLFVLAFAYTHRQRAHIRVDVIYVHLPPRVKATIDVLGDLLVFSPLIILLAIKSWDWAWYAWSTSEKMPTTGWYPPAAPLRTMVLLGFVLLALQGVAELVRNLHLLIRNKTYD